MYSKHSLIIFTGDVTLRSPVAFVHLVQKFYSSHNKEDCQLAIVSFYYVVDSLWMSTNKSEARGRSRDNYSKLQSLLCCEPIDIKGDAKERMVYCSWPSAFTLTGHSENNQA